MTLRVRCFSLLLYVAVYLSVANTVNYDQRCLPPTSDTVTKRYLYVGEQTMDISLEITDRVTHQLASHVLKILLQEVAGYVNVSLVHVHDNMNASEVLNRIAGPERIVPFEITKDVTIDDVPRTMISLEVWMGPGFSTEAWTSTKRLEHCGPLGPVGRFGWFIPTMNREGTKNRLRYVGHWKALLDDDIVRFLDLSDDMDSIRMMTKIPGTNGFVCNSTDCEDGIYYPSICKQSNISCATLLAKHPSISKVFIRHLIERLHLKVKVAWIGAHLDEYVKARTMQEKPVMFFSWKPSQLTFSNNFTHIAFPHCEDLEVGNKFPKNCGFEINQLNKVAWAGLQETVPEVISVVRAMTFTQKQYQALLELYINRLPGVHPGEIACEWVRENRRVWNRWLPANFSKKVPLFIGGIFPLTGFNYRSEGIIPAVRMAVEAINRNSSVLGDFDLNLLVENGQCSVDHVMKAFINYVNLKLFPKMIGILGPACSDTVEALAGIAKHYHSIIISYSAEGSIFHNKNFPYFFRTIPSNMQFKYVYLHLFQKMGWTRVGTLTEEGMKYPEYLSLTQDFLQSHGINFVVNRKVPKDRAHNNMTQYLEDLKEKNVRIIIGDFYDDVARAVMCEAYRQKMTAYQGYVWFFPRWFAQSWFHMKNYPSDIIASTSFSRHEVSCTREEMVAAVNGYMSFSYSYFDEDDKIMQENITIRSWKQKYFERLRREGNYTHDDYASYAYDATWVYALAIDKLLKYNHTFIGNLHTKKTANKLVEIVNETDFQGVSGRLRFVGPSRISVIYVLQFVNNESHKVGRYIPQQDGTGNLELNDSSIVWMTPNKQIPGDGRDESATCALESLRRLLDVDCEVAIVIVNIVGFGLFATLMLSCFIFIRHRYEKRVKLTELRMQQLGLATDTELPSLDQWEIQRDCIVINRKIGEGAFGTVYGGEVFFDDKGWAPVAVKTLKIGSAVEEKLDFLCEAEMMKRFDHPNVVRLLGVCTRGEPVYTIMEFMLYGDLKTYLLARRHLVADKNPDNMDEVSDKRLTSMALDVARGLSYLVEMKYVHRDIACRNCLVNNNRMVKIGDFGMTRPTYDSDYYHIGFRKAMLPVRWMAPESLLHGISTPMSDVWSYGVLVYEIITFGSFPYQGLSNNQVLEYVSKGQILNVPQGCKPEIKELIFKRCWAKDPTARPTACEIVEILANSSKLLSPCLDVPLASVEIEGTGSLELQLNRRFSLSQKTNPQSQYRRRAETLDNFENIPLFKPNLLLSNGPVTGNSLSQADAVNRSSNNNLSAGKKCNQPSYRGRYATIQYKDKPDYCNRSAKDYYKEVPIDGQKKITSL